MKTTIYVLVTVALLAAIAMKLGYLDLSGGKSKPAEESESAKPPAVVEVDPEPKVEPEPEPVAVVEPEPVVEPEAEPEPAPVEESEPAPVEESIVEAEPAPVEKSEPEPAGPVPPDEVVAELHAKYEEALASQAEGPYEEAQGKLAAGYLRALGREEKAAQEAADLNAVLHWRNEQMSVEGKPAVGEARGEVPAKLVEMRRIYEAETAKLAETRETKEAELRAKYDEALAGHVKRLTQSRKIEEALAVEKWREPYRASEEEAAEPEMLAGGGGGVPAGAGVVPAAGAPGAAGAAGDRLTLAEIDRGEVGSELEIILPGGIPMVFCWCPPGKFLMGSPPDEEGRESEQGNSGFRADETQHLVELTKGYWLGKYEVTQAQWTALMETTVEEQYSLDSVRDSENNHRLRGIGPDQPMYFVNWEESVSFCEKLGRTFRTPGRWEFALPTEAQWEYACRAGTTGPYGGTGVLEEMGWIGKNSGGMTHPVGQKKANAWGLQDMHGNVWEWCADWYGEYSRRAEVDPKGVKSGPRRILRGGSWTIRAAHSRSAGRAAFAEPVRTSALGFRVVLCDSR